MAKRLTLLVCVLATSLALGGCSKCGFWWQDWTPKSCKDDIRK